MYRFLVLLVSSNLILVPVEIWYVRRNAPGVVAEVVVIALVVVGAAAAANPDDVANLLAHVVQTRTHHLSGPEHLHVLAVFGNCHHVKLGVGGVAATDDGKEVSVVSPMGLDS